MTLNSFTVVIYRCMDYDMMDYILVNKQVFIDFLFEGFMNDMIRIEKD